MSSIFNGANEAELTGKRPPRLGDYRGTHLLKVDMLKEGIGQGKKRDPFAAADFEVAKSTNPQLAKGDKVGWAATKNAAWPEYFFSDVKRLLAGIGVAGGDPEKVTEKAMIKAFGAEQPAKGRFVLVKVTSRVKDGETYPDFAWSLATEATEVGPVNPALGASKAANEDTDDAADEADAGGGDIF